MKTYEELTQSVKIPNRYDMNLEDVEELKQWVKNDELSVLQALNYVYTLGFSKGINCEKNRLKAKNR